MNHQYKIITLITALTATGIAGLPARAEETNVEQRLGDVEQEIRILKRERELEQEAAEQKAKESPVLTAGKEGFALKSADGNFVLKLRGVVQADARFFLDDDDKNGTDTFLIRKARPILEGTLFKNFDFRFMPDFGNDSVVLFEAYAEWRYWPWLKVRGGKFKPPAGLEQLQSDPDRLFAESAFPSAILPSRDIGLQLGGDIADGVISYAVGVFNGVVDGGNGGIDNGDSKDFDARIFLEPFKKTGVEPLQGLGFGISGAIGNQDGSLATPNVASYRTAGQNVFFRYLTATVLSNTVIANGQRVRISPQAYYYCGPVGLMGEYVVSEQEIEKGLVSDHLRNRAWQVVGSIVLTGERATYRGVTPKKPFDLKNHGWGALELVGRYSVLRVDPDSFPVFANPANAAQEARAWAVGFNWYLNRNVKIVVDFEETQFDGGATRGTPAAVVDRDTERVLFTRAQVAF